MSTYCLPGDSGLKVILYTLACGISTVLGRLPLLTMISNWPSPALDTSTTSKGQRLIDKHVLCKLGYFNYMYKKRFLFFNQKQATSIVNLWSFCTYKLQAFVLTQKKSNSTYFESQLFHQEECLLTLKVNCFTKRNVYLLWKSTVSPRGMFPSGVTVMAAVL